jgi:hypothetical protein
MLVFFSLRVSSNENAGLMLVFRYHNQANRQTNTQRVIVLLNRRKRTKRDFFLCRDAQPLLHIGVLHRIHIHSLRKYTLFRVKIIVRRLENRMKMFWRTNEISYSARYWLIFRYSKVTESI